MTCIIGMIKNGEVWMAGDLMGSDGFSKKVYPDSKVFANGEFILGYTSSFRMGQLLQYNWTPPARIEGLADRDYLQVDVVESMRECFNNHGYGRQSGLEHEGGNFLIGYRGNLYEMQNNFSMLKSDDFCAIGSGCYHATGAMKVLLECADDSTTPSTILSTAIRIASESVSSVSEECTIVTTDQSSLQEGDLDERSIAMLTLAYEEDDIEFLKEVASTNKVGYPHNIKTKTLYKKLMKQLHQEDV